MTPTYNTEAKNNMTPVTKVWRGKGAETKMVTLSFAVAFLFLAAGASAFPLAEGDQAIEKSLEYLNSSQQNDGGFGDSEASYYLDLTPFAVLAIKAANQDPNTWTKNGKSPVDFMKNVSIPALNSSAVPTYYAVTIMALVAAGENPDNIIGRNLTDELVSRQNADGSFSGSAWITDEEWALLALVAAGYKNSAAVTNTVNYLLTQQKADGGFGAWCPDGSSSCPDETSLGIMALASAGYGTDSAAVQSAVSRLKQFQIPSGGMDPGWGANADSDSWAIQAIVSLGNNFTDWAKSNFTLTASPDSYTTSIRTNLSINFTIANYGNNYPFDHLATLQNPATGEFNWFKPVQDTSYSIMALMGKPFPLNSTSYTQTESSGVYRNQTFALSAAQTESWNLTLANMVQLGIETLNASLNVFAPTGSAGKQNNITVTAISSLDTLSKNKLVRVSAQSLCGNGVCESGESCSVCSSDCGECPPPPSGGGGPVIREENVTPPTCPSCPQAGEWSACEGGSQKRNSYKCGADTNYSCSLFAESRACEVSRQETTTEETAQETAQSPSQPTSPATGFAIFGNSYLPAIVVVLGGIVLAGAAILMIRRR